MDYWLCYRPTYLQKTPPLPLLPWHVTDSNVCLPWYLHWLLQLTPVTVYRPTHWSLQLTNGTVFCVCTLSLIPASIFCLLYEYYWWVSNHLPQYICTLSGLCTTYTLKHALTLLVVSGYFWSELGGFVQCPDIYEKWLSPMLRIAPRLFTTICAI